MSLNAQTVMAVVRHYRRLIYGDTSMCKCNSCNGSGNCELRDIKKLIAYIKSDIIEIFSKYKVRYSTIFDNINRYSENEDDIENIEFYVQIYGNSNLSYELLKELMDKYSKVSIVINSFKDTTLYLEYQY